MTDLERKSEQMQIRLTMTLLHGTQFEIYLNELKQMLSSVRTNKFFEDVANPLQKTINKNWNTVRQSLIEIEGQVKKYNRYAKSILPSPDEHEDYSADFSRVFELFQKCKTEKEFEKLLQALQFVSEKAEVFGSEQLQDLKPKLEKIAELNALLVDCDISTINACISLAKKSSLNSKK
jgi:hypothetical protein